MGRPVGDPLHQPLLDLRQRPLRDEQLGIRAAEQAVDDRVDDQRTDLQAELPVQLLGLEQVEAGRVRQAVDEFAVGQLLDVGDADLDDRPQVARNRGPEVSAETLVKGFQRPHLVLRDAFRPFEVVILNLDVRSAVAGEDGLRLVAGRVDRAGVDCGQQGVDFGLFQHVAHDRAFGKDNASLTPTYRTCAPLGMRKLW